MRVVLIEDEKPAIDNIIACLKNIDIPVKVIQTLSSVNNSIKWFNENSAPDLIFMGIQLSDGLSFNILKNCKIDCPDFYYRL